VQNRQYYSMEIAIINENVKVRVTVQLRGV